MPQFVPYAIRVPSGDQAGANPRAAMRRVRKLFKSTMYRPERCRGFAVLAYAKCLPSGDQLGEAFARCPGIGSSSEIPSGVELRMKIFPSLTYASFVPSRDQARSNQSPAAPTLVSL